MGVWDESARRGWLKRPVSLRLRALISYFKLNFLKIASRVTTKIYNFSVFCLPLAFSSWFMVGVYRKRFIATVDSFLRTPLSLPTPFDEVEGLG